MRYRKLVLLLISCLTAAAAIAQEPKFQMSTPIAINQSGVFKVLCLRNGNTMLLHLEPSKPILVKIYDSLHKLKASREHGCGELNVNTFKTSIFKGLFEVNGQAVLFFQQLHLTRQELVRVIIDGTTGRLVEEKMIGQSKALSKPTQFYVMPNKAADNYAILYSTDAPQFKECDVHITYFDSRHERIKDVELDVPRNDYDFMSVVSADNLPNGACITLGFAKLEINGTTSNIGRDPKNSTYLHYLGIYYIPKDSLKPRSQIVDLTTDIYPYYSLYTYNPFAQSINLLLLSYRDAFYRNGLEFLPTSFSAQLLLKMDENTWDLHHAWINNKIATNYLRQRTDTSRVYQGIPIKAFTNSNGLSTVVSEAFNRYQSVETNARAVVRETYFGDICVTQYNDDGDEIWGTILPKTQYYKSYRKYYTPTEMGKRWQDQDLFSDLPPQVYSRQFASLNTYAYNNNHYIIYNDLKQNFGNNVVRPGDTVFTLDAANAVYYKIDKKREVTKHNLLGETPAIMEYKTSFIEGADFDEQRGVYATLIQFKRRDYTSLRMAWTTLD
ncbi:MAG: hypothetical protein V4649_01130 [Bacteroidota bacterium]